MLHRFETRVPQGSVSAPSFPLEMDDFTKSFNEIYSAVTADDTKVIKMGKRVDLRAKNDVVRFSFNKFRTEPHVCL